MIPIDIAAPKHCYALMWSYGEICVGCGCCSTDPVIRAEARFNYHREMLYDSMHFNGWFWDDPEIVKIQKRNNAVDVKHHREMLKKYASEVRELRRARHG